MFNNKLCEQIVHHQIKQVKQQNKKLNEALSTMKESTKNKKKVVPKV